MAYREKKKPTVVKAPRRILDSKGWRGGDNDDDSSFRGAWGQVNSNQSGSGKRSDDDNYSGDGSYGDGASRPPPGSQRSTEPASASRPPPGPQRATVSVDAPRPPPAEPQRLTASVNAPRPPPPPPPPPGPSVDRSIIAPSATATPSGNTSSPDPSVASIPAFEQPPHPAATVASSHPSENVAATKPQQSVPKRLSFSLMQVGLTVLAMIPGLRDWADKKLDVYDPKGDKSWVKPTQEHVSKMTLIVLRIGLFLHTVAFIVFCTPIYGQFYFSMTRLNLHGHTAAFFEEFLGLTVFRVSLAVVTILSAMLYLKAISICHPTNQIYTSVFAAVLSSLLLIPAQLILQYELDKNLDVAEHFMNSPANKVWFSPSDRPELAGAFHRLACLSNAEGVVTCELLRNSVKRLFIGPYIYLGLATTVGVCQFLLFIYTKMTIMKYGDSK